MGGECSKCQIYRKQVYSESFINMSLQLYNHNWINIHSSQHFTSPITISQHVHLESKVKIHNDLNKQITTTTESFVPWSDFNFSKVCSKILLDSSTLRQFLSGLYGATYVAYSKLCGGKLFNRKRKPHTMSEKRHKINKLANYQNIIVRNSPAFDHPVWILFKRIYEK